jgi:Tfp pilus assembly protein PilV
VVQAFQPASLHCRLESLHHNARRSMRRKQCGLRGFTLVEALIASVILALATVAVLGPVLASQQQAQAIDSGSETLVLAQQLMEEITAKPFADPTDGNTVMGAGADETDRSLFDNADDYHGYSDTSKTLVAMSGASVGDAAGDVYTRTVKVEYRSSPSGGVVLSGDFALITVTVTPPDGTPVQLHKLVTRVPLKR